RGAEHQHGGAGQEMRQRLLLDRIDAEARRAAVSRQNEALALARAREAQAALSVVQLAESRAEMGLPPGVRPTRPVPRRRDRLIVGRSRSGHARSLDSMGL